MSRANSTVVVGAAVKSGAAQRRSMESALQFKTWPPSHEYIEPGVLVSRSGDLQSGGKTAGEGFFAAEGAFDFGG